jgi:transposase InsO family protein
VSRFQFVADHHATYPVKRLCELVEIERSSYYAWQTGAAGRAARAESDAGLLERIRVIHAKDEAQGVPRITVELNDAVSPEDRVNHKRVARVMRTAGLAGFVKKRRHRTTVPGLPTRSFLTCWAGTSPPRRRTSATSETSPGAAARIGDI